MLYSSGYARRMVHDSSLPIAMGAVASYLQDFMSNSQRHASCFTNEGSRRAHSRTTVGLDLEIQACSLGAIAILRRASSHQPVRIATEEHARLNRLLIINRYTSKVKANSTCGSD